MPTSLAGDSPRHLLRKRNHRVLRGLALTLTGILSFGGTAAALVNHDLQSQLNVDNIDDLLGTNRPTIVADPDDPYAGKQLNILLMGTDLRDAENVAIAGEASGMASDTTMLVHVSGDRSRVEVVSIPRDSLVAIPSCQTGDGATSAPQASAMFNSAFAIGAGNAQDLATAAACTVRTVEELTGVRVTSHVVLKMTGVIDVVDAVGGIPMCLPEPVVENRKYGTLNLPAGKQTLDGRTAISFLRARHGKGMGLEVGSDLTRIQRQQAFLDAAAHEILGQNLITNSPELYAVAKAVLGAMNTSPDLGSPTALAGLAFSLRSINLADISFTSVPVAAAPSDPNRVVWTSEAAAIWERIISDDPVPGTPAAAASEAPVEPTEEAPQGGETTAPEAPAAPATEAPATQPPAQTPTQTPTPRAGVC